MMVIKLKDRLQISSQIANFQSAALVNTRAGAVGSHEVLQNNCCVSVSDSRDMDKILGSSFEYVV